MALSKAIDSVIEFEEPTADNFPVVELLQIEGVFVYLETCVSIDYYTSTYGHSIFSAI